MSQNSTAAVPVRASRRQGRGWVAALAVATAWSAALLTAAFTVTVYTETSTSSDGGEVITGSMTLVEENGIGIALVLGLPLVVSLVVSLLLWQARWRPALPLAWVLTGLFAAFNLLAMLSVGIFVLPVTICLVIACALRRR